jgi:hypothetical protein
MMSVVRSGQPWVASAKVDATSLAAAKKVVDFQTKLSKIVPDQEALSDLTVDKASSEESGLYFDTDTLAGPLQRHDTCPTRQTRP